MDELDIRILRELVQGQYSTPLNPEFRESFRTISRKVGADKDSVARRVRVLQRDILSNWHVHINPRVLGQVETCALFDVPRSMSKDDVVKILRTTNGAWIIEKFFGTLLSLIVRSESLEAAKRKIELISTNSKSKLIFHSSIPFPESKLLLATTDWNIINALQKNPRKSYISIAEELDLSIRTVKRRLQRMVKEGILFGIPDIRPSGAKDTVMTSLIVYYFGKNKAVVDQKLMVELDPYLWHMLHSASIETDGLYISILSLALPNVAKTREILERTVQVDGIENARIELIEDIEVLLQNLPAQKSMAVSLVT